MRLLDKNSLYAHFQLAMKAVEEGADVNLHDSQGSLLHYFILFAIKNNVENDIPHVSLTAAYDVFIKRSIRKLVNQYGADINLKRIARPHHTPIQMLAFSSNAVMKYYCKLLVRLGANVADAIFLVKKGGLSESLKPHLNEIKTNYYKAFVMMSTWIFAGENEWARLPFEILAQILSFIIPQVMIEKIRMLVDRLRLLTENEKKAELINFFRLDNENDSNEFLNLCYSYIKTLQLKKQYYTEKGSVMKPAVHFGEVFLKRLIYYSQHPDNGIVPELIKQINIIQDSENIVLEKAQNKRFIDNCKFILLPCIILAAVATVIGLILFPPADAIILTAIVVCIALLGLFLWGLKNACDYYQDKKNNTPTPERETPGRFSHCSFFSSRKIPSLTKETVKIKNYLQPRIA